VPREVKTPKQRKRTAYKSEESKAMAASKVLPFGQAAANGLYLRYQIKAREREIEFSLDKDLFLVLTKQPCYYCGCPPAQTATSNSLLAGDYQYNGIDRVDSSRGYEPNNVVPCCYECNRGKAARSVEEFIAWVFRIAAFNPDGTTHLTQIPDYPERCAAVTTIYRKYERAKSQRGIYFDLDILTVRNLIRCQCSYCSAEPFVKQKASGQTEKYILYTGLDREDSAQGYTVDNVVPCCKHCNFAKNTLSVEEFYTWINRIVAFQTSQSSRLAG
jgi:hypothetical protein